MSALLCPFCGVDPSICEHVTVFDRAATALRRRPVVVTCAPHYLPPQIAVAFEAFGGVCTEAFSSTCPDNLIAYRLTFFRLCTSYETRARGLRIPKRAILALAVEDVPQHVQIPLALLRADADRAVLEWITREAEAQALADLMAEHADPDHPAMSAPKLPPLE